VINTVPKKSSCFPSHRSLQPVVALADSEFATARTVSRSPYRLTMSQMTSFTRCELINTSFVTKAETNAYVPSQSTCLHGTVKFSTDSFVQKTSRHV